MGQSSGGDVTIHYDQYIHNSYQQLIWYTFGQDGRTEMTINEQPYTLPPNLLDPWTTYDDLYWKQYIKMVREFLQYDDFIAANIITQDRMVDSSVVSNEIAAHNVYLEDDIVQNTLPKLKAGLRDIGAVLTSSFIDAQAMVEMNKVKVLSKFAADLKLHLFDVAQNSFMAFIEWEMKCQQYLLSQTESYFKMIGPYTSMVNEVSAKNVMFPWTVLDNARAIVGSLNQAPTSKQETHSPSAMQQAGTYVGMASSLTGMYAGMKTAGLFSGSALPAGAVGEAAIAGYGADTAGLAGMGTGGAALGGWETAAELVPLVLA